MNSWREYIVGLGTSLFGVFACARMIRQVSQVDMRARVGVRAASGSTCARARVPVHGLKDCFSVGFVVVSAEVSKAV